MSIAIERGIPLPRHGNTSEARLTLESMEVSDSIVIPSAGTGIIGQCNRSLAPRRFTARKLDDGRIRVWRVR